MHPGWFVAFGGTLVILAMVATGVYLRRAGAEPGTRIVMPPTLEVPPVPPTAPPDAPAGGQEAASTSTPTPSGAPPASDPAPPNVPGSSSPAGSTIDGQPSSPAAREPRVVTPGVSNQRGRTGEGEATRQSAAEPAAQSREPDASVDVDRLETELDQLLVRAGAVERGLDVLQQQQARQGLGLRSDMASRQESMKLNLSRAQQAMEQRDGVRAQRFKTLAERDVEALERFLGR